jgi:hypothetical protein
VWSSLRLADADLIERFRRARAEDYGALRCRRTPWRSACARISRQRSAAAARKA